jgi:hypothetical protein
MLNAVTPFITPDPPWLANLPLVIAIMTFLLAFGLSHIHAERARAAEVIHPEAKERSSNGSHWKKTRGFVIHPYSSDRGNVATYFS